nr:EAL domain-containing protein [Actinomycetota bacterium]
TEGLLLPGAFLPLAEESGLIVDIDEWTRVEAFRQARRWHDAGQPLRMAVNLSARTLVQPDLGALVAGELLAAGMDPASVELEINERVALDDEELPALLAPLRAAGVRIAIDDFGTGSSVLRRLLHCQVDTLKIDRCFISTITADAVEVPLVKALLALASSLGLDVVAEGVETVAQARLLERYGCELVQGFLFAQALPVAELDALLVGAHEPFVAA